MPITPGKIVADIFSSVSLPGGATAGGAIESLLRKRCDGARAIFQEELRQGAQLIEEVDDVDEVASMVYRYLRAAQEGAGRLNLRLMAAVAKGLIGSRSTFADEFLRYADMLSTMTRNELIVTATLYRLWNDCCQDPSSESTKVADVWRALQQELVPQVFDNDEGLYATAWAVSRTGLISVHAGWDGNFFQPGPELEKIMHLASLEDVIRREG